MEPTREPPIQPAMQPYSAPQPTQPAPVHKVSTFTVLRRFLRLLMRRFVYGLIILSEPFRRHAFASVLIVALLALVGWLGFQVWGPRMAAPADPRVAALPQAPAVQNYLTGRQQHDANLMWDAFSPAYQNSQLQRGNSKSALQTMVSQERRLGIQYRTLQYIGGVKLDDGGSMYYYSVDLALQNQKQRLPIVIMADQDGKIDLIISPIDSVINNLTQ